MKPGSEARPRQRWRALTLIGAVLAELGLIGAFSEFSPILRFSGMAVFVVGLILYVLQGGWRDFEPAASAAGPAFATPYPAAMPQNSW